MAAELKRQTSDQTILMQLNQEYVDAFMNADVEWYQAHLTEDFEAVQSDGSTRNKRSS